MVLPRLAGVIVAGHPQLPCLLLLDVSAAPLTVGQAILRVNRVSDAKKMLRELREAHVLEMVVKADVGQRNGFIMLQMSHFFGKCNAAQNARSVGTVESEM